MCAHLVVIAYMSLQYQLCLRTSISKEKTGFHVKEPEQYGIKSIWNHKRFLGARILCMFYSLDLPRDGHISLFSEKVGLFSKQFFILSCHLPLTASTFGAQFSRLKVLRIHLCTHTSCVCAFEDGYHSQKHLKCLLGSSAENRFQNVQKDGKLLVLCCILFVSTKQHKCQL